MKNNCLLFIFVAIAGLTGCNKSTNSDPAPQPVNQSGGPSAPTPTPAEPPSTETLISRNAWCRNETVEGATYQTRWELKPTKEVTFVAFALNADGSRGAATTEAQTGTWSLKNNTLTLKIGNESPQNSEVQYTAQGPAGAPQLQAFGEVFDPCL